MNHSSEKGFPLNAKDYDIYEEVGEGVSATVYRAVCIPLNVTVAVKVLDLEKCNNDNVLASVRREVQTMSSLDHPNVLRSYCSFTDEHKLWVVMPYMAGGSCLHIMKSTHPEGFEESVIATLLYEVLKALAYLHAHGYIHRDVKAGNILIDSNGAVKLGDFGVSACMFDTGDRQRTRNTFVGTPCWMAPEVMHQLHGYDFKADIWSFGITALELARGHAPFSKYPPMKVLLMTLQNAPPGLDYKSDKKFSKYFRSLVAACLVKDPKKRPSSEKLLKHRFFQKARSIDYVAKTLLNGLTPLGDRFRTLKDKEADLLVQNKAICGDKEKLSQQEYIRGISAWNFNLEDLKTEASINQDYDGIPNTEDPELYCKHKDGCDEKPSLGRVDSFITPRMEAKLNELQSMDSSIASEPISPVEEPKEQVKPKSQLERNSSSVGDTAEGTIIRRKGRFKVTSEELSPKGSTPNSTPNPVSESSTGQITSNVLATTVLPSLQSILQQNNMQKETLLKLIKTVEGTFELTETGISDSSQTSLGSAREKELLTVVGQLQQSNDDLVKELQRLKTENAQLDSQINELVNKEEERKPKENGD